MEELRDLTAATEFQASVFATLVDLQCGPFPLLNERNVMSIIRNIPSLGKCVTRPLCLQVPQFFSDELGVRPGTNLDVNLGSYYKHNSPPDSLPTGYFLSMEHYELPIDVAKDRDSDYRKLTYTVRCPSNQWGVHHEGSHISKYVSQPEAASLIGWLKTIPRSYL